jgi:hypothetical protein
VYPEVPPGSYVLSQGEVVGIVIGAIIFFFSLVFMGHMIRKERKGEPLFSAVSSYDDYEDRNTVSDVQTKVKVVKNVSSSSSEVELPTRQII